MDLFQRAFEQAGRAHLDFRVRMDADAVPARLHLPGQHIKGIKIVFKTGTDAAVLHRLMGIAAGHHRLTQPLPQPEGQLLGALTVLSDVLAVQIHKIKAHQQLRRQVGDMPAGPEGVSRPHQDRVFGKEVQQLRRREEPVFGFVRL